MFTTKTDQPAENNGFRATASTTVNTLPVPVEVANDIFKISRGEPLVLEKSPELEAEVKNEAPATGAMQDSAKVESAKDCQCDAKEVREDQQTRKLNGKVSKKKQGQSVNYVIRPGDTLMKIAFAKYGNVYRWREILEANRGRIKNFSSLTAGMALTINGVEYIVIERNGQPYLIRRADTLVKISNKIYGTPRYWSDLWHNNPHLIHDPNKIYAGFTLYYRNFKDWAKPKLERAMTDPPGNKASASSSTAKAVGGNKVTPRQPAQQDKSSSGWTPSRQ